MPAFVEHVGVNHGGGHVSVAEQFLHGTNVVARLQLMRSKAVAQGVGRGGFGHIGGINGFFHGALHLLFV